MNGFRLLQNSIERISVTVPRLRKEFFQDDIFQDTRDVEKPDLDVDEWLKGKVIEHRWINLNATGRVSCIFWLI